MKHPISTACLTALAAATSLWAATPTPSASQFKHQPNILFILVDDMAFNDLGCYAFPGDFGPIGQPAPAPFPQKSAVAAPNQAVAVVRGKSLSLTPNIDRLAAQGVKFANYHAPSSVCSPSRIGLMTGRMPARFELGGIISATNTSGLPSREITLPEALKGCGYATAAFGKWHLGNGPQHEPTRHGFDHYWPATGPRATELERLTNQVLAFVEENRHGPFFAYFAPHQPHHPNVPHPDFAGSSTRLLGPRTYLKGDGSTDTQVVPTSNYHDVVHELDFRIGQLLQKLDALGLAENTIVVFTSDNGPWTNQPLAAAGRAGIIGTGYPYRGGKFEFWEGSTRVPAILRYPGEIPAGFVSHAPASGLDWLPTLVHRGGGTVPADRLLDGFDLWPFLVRSSEISSPRAVVAYERGKKILAVSDGQFKQFENRLVSLQSDLTELVDVTPANAVTAAQLNRQLAAANARLAEDTPGLEKAATQEIILDVGAGRYVEVPADGSRTFQVSLRNDPSADLVVHIRQRSSSPGLSASPTTLTFTTTSGRTPQTVTVKSIRADRSNNAYAIFEAVGPAALPLREIYLHIQP